MPDSPLYSDTILLLHGTPDLLEMLPRLSFCQHHILFWGPTSSHTSLLPFSVTISHKEAGGVLGGSWTFQSNRDFQPVKTAPVRVPAQIIHRAVRTNSARLDPNETPINLATAATLPLDDCHTQVFFCPTVFGRPDALLNRRLTLGELCNAFDVPSESCPDSLRPRLHTEVTDLYLPFLATPPLKVLQKVFEAWQKVPYTLLPVTTVSLAAPELTTMHMYTPGLDFAVEEAHRQAVKADDADVPVALWDKRIWGANAHDPGLVSAFRQRHTDKCPLASIRSGLLAYWRVLVWRDLRGHMQRTHGSNWLKSTCPEASQDRQQGRDCLVKASAADWWEWKGGSTLFFWRWTPEFRQMARDGQPLWVGEPQPRYRRPQRGEREPNIHAQIKAKLLNVIGKGYVAPGNVTSLTSYFGVPKGPSDTRMVYDSSKSGLNDVMWVPSFSLPTMEALTNLLDRHSWMSDLDMGEQFLNFPLDPKVQPLCGIDVRPYLGTIGNKATHWLRWTRCMMGLRTSPYVAVKGTHIAEEIVFGDRHCPTNPFRWHSIRLNLPGMSTYTPSLPWVSKLREDGTLAAGVTWCG
jgi:hypothetical protein